MKDLDFEAIYERYHQALYRFCFSIVGNAEDARDALQNTMVKALRSLPGEEREIQLKPWLFRVAHNESIELLRRRRDQVELDARLASTGGPAEEAAMRERLRTLLADLRELPERQRTALVMRELAGLEFAEIAEALGTSAGVARQTVYEARLSLHQLKAGREMDCGKVRWELSEEDGRVARRRDIQAHLRECAECRAFREAIDARKRDLSSLAPLPAAASAGLLHAILAGGGGAGGSGLGGTVGAGAGKVAASSVAVKSAATVAVVAAIAVPAADRAGLVDVGLFHRGTPQSRTTEDASSAAGSTGASSTDSRHQTTDAGSASSHDQQDGPALTEGSVAGQDKKSGNASPAGSAPAGAAAPTGASQELPSASNHGQETAASHGGGRDYAHSNTKGKAKGKAHPTASGKSSPHEPSPSHGGGSPEKEHPSHAPNGQPPKQMTPDNGHEKPLQPSESPKAQGQPKEPGGHESKEAR